MKKIFLLSILMMTFINLMAQSEYTYEVKNLEVNTKYSDFGTTLYNINKVIYTSAKRGFGNNSSVWKKNNQPFLDLYQGSINSDGEIIDSERMPDIINSKFHEGIVAMSKDSKTLYFTKENYIHKKKILDNNQTINLGIYVSKLDADNQWTSPEPLSFTDKNYSYGHPSISNDGKRLYFTSNMPGGFGKTDIYYADTKEDGSFGVPVNLGSKINTSGRDEFPFISIDNILYFSSNGRNGLGNLDIYSAELKGNTFFDVIHLESPINSSFDDFAFIFNDSKNKGYFSSNRDGGKGDDDIYYFEYKVVKCNQFVTGKVTELNSSSKVKGAVVKLYDENGALLESVEVDENASYSFKIDCSKNYTIKASNKGYEETSKKFISSAENQKTNQFNIELKAEVEEFVKVEEKILIKINPIYFDLNSSEIRKDAEDELKKVVDIMIKYPELTIVCGSHTDSRAGINYNRSLSEIRAQQTIKYIVSKGISSDRISGKGYGETQLINKCSDGVKCKESEHQLNRRTEFVVIRKN